MPKQIVSQTGQFKLFKNSFCFILELCDLVVIISHHSIFRGESLLQQSSITRSIEKVWQLNYVFGDTGIWVTQRMLTNTVTTKHPPVLLCAFKRCSCSPFIFRIALLLMRVFILYFPSKRPSLNVSRLLVLFFPVAVSVCVHP